MLLTRIAILASIVLLASCVAAANSAGSHTAATNGLVPSLQVKPSGNTVQFTLQLSNTGTTPIPLEFTSGQSYDFAVLQGSRELWRWSADQMFTQALRSETLAPGATRTYEATWSPPAGTRGEFTAAGILTATNRRVEQRAIFRLP
jgi:hypothetical protein